VILFTDRDRRLVIEFEQEEAELLALLARQLEQFVDDRAEQADPLVKRLFPEAYRDDPDAAAEFRRYTRDALRSYKADGAQGVATALTVASRVELDRLEADRWARTLTDIRLMVGTRLGLADDESEVPDGLVGDIYHWLTELQGGIVAALDRGLADPELGEASG
jgi:hypothetical protein